MKWFKANWFGLVLALIGISGMYFIFKTEIDGFFSKDDDGEDAMDPDGNPKGGVTSTSTTPAAFKVGDPLESDSSSLNIRTSPALNSTNIVKAVSDQTFLGFYIKEQDGWIYFWNAITGLTGGPYWASKDLVVKKLSVSSADAGTMAAIAAFL